MIICGCKGMCVIVWDGSGDVDSDMGGLGHAGGSMDGSGNV